MEFKFTEGNYRDEFKFGGSLEIIASGAAEVEALIQHFKLFKDSTDIDTLKARIEALQSGSLSYVMKSDKRPMYEVESCLDHEFIIPYKDWALKSFGYDGTFPDMEIPRKWDGLLYTNYQARLYTDNEHICYMSYVSSEPWNKKDAHDYAHSRVKDCISEEFGTRYQEPEFIRLGNNHLKDNPNYLKRHRPTPSATNSRLKKAFFAWWLNNHASEEQKEIVKGNQEIAKNAPYMSAFEFEKYESHIYYAKTGKDYESVTFAEFAAMGKSE